MKFYNSESEDVVEDIIRMLEKETGNQVFTLKVLRHEEMELDVIVVFENKDVLSGSITIIDHDGKIGCRVRGNYL